MLSAGAKGLIVGLLTAPLAFLGIMMTANPSSASPPESCAVFRTNVQGADGGAYGSQTGIQQDVWFAASNNDCDRVTSVGTINGSGQVEFGWILGWLPKGSNVYTGSGACNDTYHTTPQIFRVWTPIGGSYHCSKLGTDGSNVFRHMKVTDGDRDAIWDMTEHGGSISTSVPVNFSVGTIVTNAERHSLADSMFAHFTGLQKQVAGNGTTWFTFCCSRLQKDNDDDYYWTVQNGADENTLVEHV